MDTKKLKTLLKAAEAGSYSKAADELGYTRAAFVHIARTVEDELGVPLLKKDHTGVTLSAEGQALKPFIDVFLDSEKKLKDAASRLADAHANVIRIASYPSVADYYLTAVIKELQEQFPQTTLDLQIYSGAAIPLLIKEGKADLGFADIYNKGGNEWIPLCTDQMYLAVPKIWISDDLETVSLEILREHPLLISDYILPIIEQYLTAYPPLKEIRLTANNSRSLLAMVDNEIGLAFSTKLNLGHIPTNIRLMPTVPPVTRELGLLARSFDNLSALQKKIVRFLTDRISGSSTI